MLNGSAPPEGGLWISTRLAQYMEQMRNQMHPRIWERTFRQFQERVKKQIDILARILPGVSRAKYVQQRTDEELAKGGKDSELITCAKGCSACCHLNVGVTDDEAEQLADLVITGKVRINIQRLKMQATLPDDDREWWTMPKERSRCVFLGDNSLCMVYAERPTACRLHNSVDEPWKCDRDYNPNDVPAKRYVSQQGEVITTAALQVSPRGHLPRMLLSKLFHHAQKSIL